MTNANTDKIKNTIANRMLDEQLVAVIAAGQTTDNCVNRLGVYIYRYEMVTAEKLFQFARKTGIFGGDNEVSQATFISDSFLSVHSKAWNAYAAAAEYAAENRIKAAALTVGAPINQTVPLHQVKNAKKNMVEAARRAMRIAAGIASLNPNASVKYREDGKEVKGGVALRADGKIAVHPKGADDDLQMTGTELTSKVKPETDTKAQGPKLTAKSLKETAKNLDSLLAGLDGKEDVKITKTVRETLQSIMLRLIALEIEPAAHEDEEDGGDGMTDEARIESLEREDARKAERIAA